MPVACFPDNRQVSSNNEYTSHARKLSRNNFKEKRRITKKSKDEFIGSNNETFFSLSYLTYKVSVLRSNRREFFRTGTGKEHRDDYSVRNRVVVDVQRLDRIDRDDLESKVSHLYELSLQNYPLTSHPLH